VGRGTLASGHPSFPLLIVVVPVLDAERSFLFAFAALHPKWGNNLNLFSRFVSTLQRLSTLFL
jgi:hypothetical protein